MKKLIFILLLIIALFSVANAETVYIPEKVVFPTLAEDLDPILALEGAYLQQLEELPVKQLFLWIKDYEIHLDYDKHIGKITDTGINLTTQIDLEFPVSVHAHYDYRTGMIVSWSANADLQEGEQYIQLFDSYTPGGYCHIQRKIQTVKEDKIYYFITSNDPATIYSTKLSGTSEDIKIPANRWICFTVQDGAVIDSTEEMPEYSEKLADIVVAGELDPLKLKMVDGELQFIPDADDIAAAMANSANNVQSEALVHNSETKEENKEELKSQPTATPQAVGEPPEKSEYKNIRISVNGEKVILLDKNDEQQKSYIADGNIYIPIIPFINSIGGTIEYDAENNQITIELPEISSGTAAVPDLTPSPTVAPEPKEPYLLGWGEGVDLDYANFTLADFKVLREIRGNAEICVYYAEKEGIKYLAAIGTIKNNTGAPLRSNSIVANILVDGKNNYRGRAAIMYNESVVDELPAAAEGKLYLYAEVPDEIAQNFQNAEIEFGMNEMFGEIPGSIESADLLYLLTAGNEQAILAREEPPREKSFYSESPSLPIPTSYADLMEIGHSSSKSNNKITRIEYRYTAHYNNDKIADLTDKVISGLQEDGYTIARSGSDYVVNNGNKKLATISCSGNQMTVSITPGNEKLKTLPEKKPSSTIGTIEEVKFPTVHIGGNMKTSYAELTFSKSGQTNQLLSYSSKSAPRNWRYYEPNSSSNLLFYVHGLFKNKTSREINISNIYAELTFDGKEKYNCSVTSLYEDGRGFTTYVIAQDQVEYYIYAEVPKSVLNSYRKCELKIGLTKDFDYRVLSNGVYNFDRCDDIIIVDLSK